MFLLELLPRLNVIFSGGGRIWPPAVYERGECIGVYRRVQKRKNVILKPFFLILPLLNVYILHPVSNKYLHKNVCTQIYIHRYT